MAANRFNKIKDQVETEIIQAGKDVQVKQEAVIEENNKDIKEDKSKGVKEENGKSLKEEEELNKKAKVEKSKRSFMLEETTIQNLYELKLKWVKKDLSEIVAEAINEYYAKHISK